MEKGDPMTLPRFTRSEMVSLRPKKITKEMTPIPSDCKIVSPSFKLFKLGSCTNHFSKQANKFRCEPEHKTYVQ